MLPIEKLAAIIIFVIILAVLIIFSQIPQMILGQTNKQQELNSCCQAYVLSRCPESLSSINCGGKTLETLARDNGLLDADGNVDVNRTRNYCDCFNKIK
ncbi:hypothetical protein A3K64_01180 [Candidatus Micrarchaeota archaeon RBG_16_36_9]|nr:MAG: hypothetical protein A3K64_01180 [Candidatus Micrarchaeota archaeon RBG_16_36_9]